jgi:CubicO group peptidase (beta-lactamase class C family)
MPARKGTLKMATRSGWWILAANLVAAAIVQAAPPQPKPETVGMSSERLGRIHEMVMTRVKEGAISGAVTAVSRQDKVVHFDAHGEMDLESKQPMTKDALFHLASTCKPVTAAAIPILVEDGKLLLTERQRDWRNRRRESLSAVRITHPARVA